MGTSERKQREREERELLFLSTAETMIENEGFIQLQMARLAKACDYATGTLYQHFTSREDLLVALAARQSARHLALFQQIAAWQAPSRTRMFAISVLERDFIRDNASYAKLSQYIMAEAVWENASQMRRDQVLNCGQPMAQIVNQIVQQGIDDGDLDPQGASAMELGMGVWALCEGMHSIEHTQGLMEAFDIPRGDFQYFRHMNRLLNGMNWHPLLNISDHQALEAEVQHIQQAFQ